LEGKKQFRGPYGKDVNEEKALYQQTPPSSCRQFILAFAEAQDEGRLLKHNPATNETTVLLKGLRFANGVALSSDESFVLVNELALVR
jgi:sugar lactone lactonase YvrE